MKTKMRSVMSILLPTIVAVVGLVLAFVLGIAGTFGVNKTVIVTYDTYVMLNDSVKEELVDYCKDTFPGATVTVSTSSDSGEVVISGNVEDKANEMQKTLTDRYPDGTFSVAYHEAKVESASTYSWRALIVAGSLVVIAFVYSAIRYRVSQAFAQLIAGVYAPALTIAIAGISRLPVGEFVSVAAFFAMVIAYVLTFFVLNKARKQFKELDVPAGEAVAIVVKDTQKIAFTTLLVVLLSSLAVIRLGLVGMVFVLVAVLAATCAYRFTFPALLTIFKTSTDQKDKEKEHYTNK